jgi:hypothetical protein
MPLEVWYCNECGKIVSHAEIDPAEDDVGSFFDRRSLSATIVAKVPTVTVYPCGHLQGASRERPTV